MITVSSQIKLHNTNESLILRLLYKDLNKYKKLNKEDEKELFIKAKAGDFKAKDMIIYSNMKFAIAVAKKYANNNVPLEDFVSESFLGLLEAYETFDIDKNVRFITHAVYYIQDKLSNITQGVVKLPNTYRVIRKKINKERNVLEQIHSCDIPSDMLADNLGLTTDKLNSFLYTTVSIDNWFEQYGEEML